MGAPDESLASGDRRHVGWSLKTTQSRAID
jgi:hypothetical protein